MGCDPTVTCRPAETYRPRTATTSHSSQSSDSLDSYTNPQSALLLSNLHRPRHLEGKAKGEGTYKILSTTSQVWFFVGLSHFLAGVPCTGSSPPSTRSTHGSFMPCCSAKARTFSPEEVYLALVSPNTMTAFPTESAPIASATCCRLALRAATSLSSDLHWNQQAVKQTE